MPGVAREEPAENTCSRKDPTGMALPAFPKGKPRHQESWGRALIDPSGGPSLGVQWSLCSHCRGRFHMARGAAKRKKKKKPNRVERVTSGLEDCCSEHRSPLFLLHHECVELRQDNRTKVKDS